MIDSTKVKHSLHFCTIRLFACAKLRLTLRKNPTVSFWPRFSKGILFCVLWCVSVELFPQTHIFCFCLLYIQGHTPWKWRRCWTTATTTWQQLGNERRRDGFDFPVQLSGRDAWRYCRANLPSDQRSLWTAGRVWMVETHSGHFCPNHLRPHN